MSRQETLVGLVGLNTPAKSLGLVGSASAAFQNISLEQMDSVKLMNRTDRKYWFSSEQLYELLQSVKDDYYLLEVEGECNLPYSTIYYDTVGDDMYRNHHRGKLNRFKVRRRNYLSTQSSFLEVKFKNNKGRTVKDRQSSQYCGGFTQSDDCFIRQHTPYSSSQLREVLKNGFRRLTLVSKQMNERCTIDSEIEFFSCGNEAKLHNLIVVEVKTEGRSRSPIIEALNERRIKSSGFSKYCIGRIATDRGLNMNLFKRKEREICKKLAL